MRTKYNTEWIKKYCHCKDDAFQLIIDIAFVYDGYTSAEDLKNLIDELVDIADVGLKLKI